VAAPVKPNAAEIRREAAAGASNGRLKSENAEIALINRHGAAPIW
jgi:hypothetical protein